MVRAALRNPLMIYPCVSVFLCILVPPLMRTIQDIAASFRYFRVSPIPSGNYTIYHYAGRYMPRCLDHKTRTVYMVVFSRVRNSVKINVLFCPLSLHIQSRWNRLTCFTLVSMATASSFLYMYLPQMRHRVLSCLLALSYNFSNVIRVYPPLLLWPGCRIAHPHIAGFLLHAPFREMPKTALCVLCRIKAFQQHGPCRCNTYTSRYNVLSLYHPHCSAIARAMPVYVFDLSRDLSAPGGIFHIFCSLRSTIFVGTNGGKFLNHKHVAFFPHARTSMVVLSALVLMVNNTGRPMSETTFRCNHRI